MTAFQRVEQNDRKVQVSQDHFVPGLSFKFSFKKTLDCFAGLLIVYSLMEFANLIRVLTLSFGNWSEACLISS